MMSTVRRITHRLYKATHPAVGEILMFHRVLSERSPKEDVLNYDIEVTPHYFEQTLITYRNRGYRFATLDEFYHELTKKRLLRQPQKMVCITFDDGFHDNFDTAYPILKKHNCPFTIYVTSGFVEPVALIWWCKETSPGEKGLALTVEQLRALANDSLCTIGSHTVTHPHLAELTPEEQTAELRESKQRLEEILQRPVEHLSYPHGSYNRHTVAIAQQCGYKTATRNYGDTVRYGDTLYTLNRRYVKED